MSYTAHVDAFVRDNLPPRSEWPEFLFDLPELKYPARLNCATELLDKPVTRGYGHRIALRSPDGECTYTQLFTQANRLANVLVREMGLKPGNRVLLRGPNNPMMAGAWLAVMKAGGVCVATMPLLRAKELTDVITKAQITHALCDKRLQEELDLALPNCPTLTTIRYWYDDAPDSLDSLALRQPLTFGNVPTASDDVALIAFTSGTTGKPKGTVHFHRDHRRHRLNRNDAHLHLACARARPARRDGLRDSGIPGHRARRGRQALQARRGGQARGERPDRLPLLGG